MREEKNYYKGPTQPLKGFDRHGKECLFLYLQVLYRAHIQILSIGLKYS